MKQGSFRTLNTEQLRALRQLPREPYVVNVLSQKAYQEGHIPDSDNVPVARADFAERVEQRAGGKSRDIVVYCAGLECTASREAARQLVREGFERVWDYEGGLDSWQRAGLPVQSADRVEVLSS